MSDAPALETEVAEPVVTTQTAPRPGSTPETRTRRQPPYHVIVLNDDEHTFEYVIEMLMKLFGHPLSTAHELANRIDREGRAIVYTTHREKAELKREQILSYGPDPRIPTSPGPLGCYIEPAPIE